MCSIRKTLTLALAVAAGVASATGCQQTVRVAAEPVDTAPMPIDEAMQRRGEWPRLTAEFQNGGTVAGATRFPYSPATVQDGADRAIFGPEFSNALLDTGYFIGQTFFLFATPFIDPPGTKKVYRGVFYDPTYTAMPILPPDEVPAEDAYVPPPVPPEAEDEGRELPPAPSSTEEGTRQPGEVPPDAAPPVIGPGVSEPSPGEPAPRVPVQVDEAAPPPEPSIPDAQPQPEPADGAPAPGEPSPVPVEPAPVPVEPAPEPDLNKDAAAAPIEPPPTAEPLPDAAVQPAPEAVPAPDAAAEPTPVPPPAPDAVEPAPEPAAEPAPEPPAEPAPEPAPAPDLNK